MSVSNVTIHLAHGPEQLVLHDASGPFPVLQFGSELTMHLDQTPTDTLQAVIDLLTKAVEARDAAATVPAEVAGEDGVRWIGVPQQRQGAAA
ncbi:hypothetical protein PV334_20200 [Streptomyces sp. ME02-7008A-1]|uniref:hypothetical protein n=1 Tax=unclassified Streptomyces TaxID=2593676 RepID=UPI0029A88417|nr:MULTISPECIES: hypothetical protein [unclassified Streptomyces]MDX3183572.1 hypothetical protein [Streptomyces sp. ME02-7008A-1]MDX3304024.1 hypothetical protein [Streptomyces sp. ME02-7008A]